MGVWEWLFEDDAAEAVEAQRRQAADEGAAQRAAIEANRQTLQDRSGAPQDGGAGMDAPTVDGAEDFTGWTHEQMAAVAAGIDTGAMTDVAQRVSTLAGVLRDDLLTFGRELTEIVGEGWEGQLAQQAVAATQAQLGQVQRASAAVDEAGLAVRLAASSAEQLQRTVGTPVEASVRDSVEAGLLSFPFSAGTGLVDYKLAHDRATAARDVALEAMATWRDGYVDADRKLPTFTTLQSPVTGAGPGGLPPLPGIDLGGTTGGGSAGSTGLGGLGEGGGAGGLGGVGGTGGLGPGGLGPLDPSARAGLTAGGDGLGGLGAGAVLDAATPGARPPGAGLPAGTDPAAVDPRPAFDPGAAAAGVGTPVPRAGAGGPGGVGLAQPVTGLGSPGAWGGPTAGRAATTRAAGLSPVGAGGFGPLGSRAAGSGLPGLGAGGLGAGGRGAGGPGAGSPGAGAGGGGRGSLGGAASSVPAGGGAVAAAGAGGGAGRAGTPGMGMPMMGGGRGGKGGGDGEHKAASYLVSADHGAALVGELPLVAPPVIGR